MRVRILPEAPLPRSWEIWIDWAVLAGSVAFLFFHFHPRLLFLPTITSGGDTPSHYYALQYLKEHLLPRWQIAGWSQSHYAGFPMLQNYFPLPFLLMTAFSWVMPLPVAFKLGTMIGVLLLPIGVYIGLRGMSLKFPVPILGAVATLPFLFMEANSMWGGNIPSTLAGEFCYSLGLALTMAWMGTLYKGISSGKFLIGNAILLALIGLSHAYALLFAGTLSLFFLFYRERFAKHFVYLAEMHGLAILFLSFWLAPLLAGLPWTTPYSIAWTIGSWKEMLPRILWPLAVLAPAAFLFKPRRPLVYLLFGQACAWYLFLIAPDLGVVDIRFVPFAQISWCLLAALGAAFLTHRLRGRMLLPLLALLGTFWWTTDNSKTIDSWVKWNYTGFEKKPTWPLYQGINNLLKGSVADPRVIYEHSDRNNALGSLRAWESLPLFSGRDTLEHAYFQASPSAPFVFYMQSEVSQQISCPFPEYGCTSFNLKRAEYHLRLFNVSDIIAISDPVKNQLRRLPEYKLKASMAPYEIYTLDGPHHYVEALAFEPVLWTGGKWKEAAYLWFRNIKLDDVTLIFPVHFRGRDDALFPLQTGSLANLPRESYPEAPRPVLWENVTNEEISFRTTQLHRPHLIKVSYDPHWKVEGAQRIYLASPAFMVVFPEQETVRLYYGRSWSEYLGIGLTVFGIVLAGALWARKKGRPWPVVPASKERLLRGVSLTFLLLAGIGLGLAVLRVRGNSLGVLLRKGVACRDAGKLDLAQGCFEKILTKAPLSGYAETAQYFLAITRYLKHDWEPAIQEFERLIQVFPDGHYRAEAYYHIALCQDNLGRRDDLRKTVAALRREFPNSPWARYAIQRWGRPPRDAS
jgi:tetratricopeptide (TPR) repeat protein